jgi:trehalose-6-phosphate synthase
MTFSYKKNVLKCVSMTWRGGEYLGVRTPGRYNKIHWQGYLAANKRFADKLVEVINVDGDFVWVNDYHLMLLPTFLRKRFNTVRCGYFLHCPFPSSEIFRTFPNRDLVLRGLLNADVVGRARSRHSLVLIPNSKARRRWTSVTERWWRSTLWDLSK